MSFTQLHNILYLSFIFASICFLIDVPKHSKAPKPKTLYLDIIDLIGGDLCVIKPKFL